LAQGQLGMLALGLNRRQLAAFFDHSAGNLGDFDVHLLRQVAHPSTPVSRVAELGQQWFGGLGQETVLSLVTDLHHWVLLLWGSRPADPSRLCSRAGAATHSGGCADYSAATDHDGRQPGWTSYTPAAAA
jgi:hypothetical protein